MWDLIRLLKKALGMGKYYHLLGHRYSWTFWMIQDGAIFGWQSLNWHFWVMLGWKLKFMYCSTTSSYSHTHTINASKLWTFKLKFIMPYYFNKWNQYQDHTIWIYESLLVQFLCLCLFPHFKLQLPPENCSAFFLPLVKRKYVHFRTRILCGNRKIIFPLYLSNRNHTKYFAWFMPTDLLKSIEWAVQGRKADFFDILDHQSRNLRTEHGSSNWG